MTELELEHQLFLTKAKLEKQKQTRDRIMEHAKDTNDQDLAWSIVKECSMIRMAHSECKAS